MKLDRLRKSKTKLQRLLTLERLRYLLWKTFRFSAVDCPHTGVYISSRNDRYGANSIPWLNAVVLARISKQKLYHHCSIRCFRYRDTVIHQLLLRNSTQCKRCTRCDLHNTEGWFHGQHEKLMQHTGGKPLPDVIAESELKKEFFGYYRRESQIRHWTLPFDANELITIHVRLGDVKDKERPDKQGFIGEEKLVELIRKLHSQHPHHHIHLVTSPNKADIDTCQLVIEKSNVDCTVLGSDDVDYDLYLMMCSDVLILSRSTFCFVAALLHQGSSVFSYTRWIHFNELVGDYSADGTGGNRSKYLKILE